MYDQNPFEGFGAFLYGAAVLIFAFIVITFFTGCASIVPKTPMDGWPDPGWSYPNEIEKDHVIEEQYLNFERLT